MKNPKNICGGFFGGVSRKRRVWGGNPNKYLTGGQMSEKRNLVHWSILALRDCKLPLTSVRHFFTVCINAFCKFSFAYYSFIGSRFWQTAFLFLLPIIRERAFLPVFAKMTTDTELPARHRRKPFPLSVIQKTRKWQPDRQKIFLFTLNTTALPVLPKMGAKKAANLFQDLLLHVLPLGGGLFNFGIGWGGSTPRCRPLSTHQQRQMGLLTAGAARSS